ncbi:MAG: hypothetical protein ACYDFT_01885 [Thermoplasmata archaeon]
MPQRSEWAHWAVLAWVRFRLPEPAPAVLLTRGPPPPPQPPLDILEPEPVATDPTMRVYAHIEELDGGLIRLAWHANDPDHLVAEYREPRTIARLPPDRVRRFWEALRPMVAELGPLPVEAADPRPAPRPAGGNP